MNNFRDGQRVLVQRDESGNDVNALGTVRRLRLGDNGAWIALDLRHPQAHHPFGADDPHGRGTHVLAYPEDCEMVS